MKATSITPGRDGGNLEDINETLTILEPEDTPFFSACSKQRTSATDPYVVADTLRAPRTLGTKEGEPMKGGNNKAKNRKRFKSQVHRVFDEYAVSDVEEAISRRGGNAVIDDEFGYVKAKAIREHKRDMEAICLSNQEMVTGGDDVMQTRGFFKWVQNSAQATNPVPVDFRPPAGSILSGLGTGDNLFTEQQFVALCKSVKQVYGSKQSLELYAGDDIINTVDNFSRIDPNGQSRYTITQSASEKTISLTVSIFDCSFARVHMISDQFVRFNSTTSTGETNAGALVNPKYWMLQFLEDMIEHDNMDDDGAGRDGWLRSMFALNCKNPKGQAAIYGV